MKLLSEMLTGMTLALLLVAGIMLSGCENDKVQEVQNFVADKCAITVKYEALAKMVAAADATAATAVEIGMIVCKAYIASQSTTTTQTFTTPRCPKGEAFGVCIELE